MLVLVLGAGFSSYAGLPTMAQFGGVFHDRLQRVVNAVNAKDPETKKPRPILGADQLQRAGETYREFRDYCRRALRFIDIDYNNLEELFCAAEAMREANTSSIALARGPVSIDEIITALELWTWNIYQGLPDYFAHSSSEVISGRYHEFMEWIKPICEKVSVLTTNYDVLFETIAFKDQVPIRYPFQANAFSVKRNESYLSDSDSSVLVCKLHGSVTYFKDNTPGEQVRGICSEVAHDGDNYGGSKVQPGRGPHPAVVCLGTLGCLREEYVDSHTPAIIAPTYAKLQRTDWLRETWNKAVGALAEADVVAIIGYSFPSSDGFMRAMLLSAMAKRDQKKPLCVLLVTPDKDAAGRVSDLFRPVVEESGFVWRARRFEDWSPSEDPKLDSWLRQR